MVDYFNDGGACMKKRIYQTLIELGNGKASSAALKRFAQSTLSRQAIPGYINAYKIELGDIDRPSGQYTSLHDFFTRRLKTGARPIADAELVSPVDGRLEIHGTIQGDSRFQVKGID